MLQSVPSRAAFKPRLLASFNGPTFVVIQVLGANTLYLAETEQQLMMTDDSGATIDALQLTQAGAPGGLYFLWWNGPMYAAGSQPAGQSFKPFIGIPGVNTGGLVNAEPRAYGIEPSQPTPHVGGIL